jgi:D-lactate dehydrogenase
VPSEDAALAPLAAILGDRLRTSLVDRLARSSDASLYRLVPQAVLRPRGVDEVRKVLGFAAESGRHLTFRGGGTSLSGQTISDDLLVELVPFFRGIEVLEGGRRVQVEPGVIASHVNRVLAPYGYRLGPDPASIEAATIGGILANNSSGMCCGVAQNSYHTLDSMVVVLADGTVVDTAEPDSDLALARARPDVHGALLALRHDILARPELAERIRRKFTTKNTTGYSLNAFVDFERPVDILARLMVGSEGTLGFVARVTFRTVRDLPSKATGLLYFDDLREAGAAVAPLAEAGADALEIMDAASLRSQADDRVYPFAITDRMAALLVEYAAEDAPALGEAVSRAEATLARFNLLLPATFTTNAAERNEHWRLRRGLAPRAGAMRPSGTVFIIEDVAVPVGRLAEAIGDFQQLFVGHGAPETVIFGHAKDGNLHFILAEDLRSGQARERYDRLMNGLVDIVVGRYDGALKGEHGSGRNMAPWVRAEWGEEAYGVMEKVKVLLDPRGIFNPGVILNSSPTAHLESLKTTPTISPLADRCIECGFCEPRCPSREMTLTPRQRIVIVRTLRSLESESGAQASAMRKALLNGFERSGLLTCAGDSMCQTSCPVKIDTGALVKEIKEVAHSALAKRLAGRTARSHGMALIAARAGLRVARVVRGMPVGRALVSAVTAPLNRGLPWLVPQVTPSLDLPLAATSLPRPRSAREPRRGRVVYFPSCLTRVIGALPGEELRPVGEALLDLLAWAGFEVSYPAGVAGLCCGMPYASKSFAGAAEVASQRTAEALWNASREGRDAVVTDASPCAGTLGEAVKHLQATGRTLRALDFASFWAGEVIPHLGTAPKRAGHAILHPTCTLVKAGALGDLLAVARAHSAEVSVPLSAECCGFAGDKGFLVPELTARATRHESAEVRDLDPDGKALLVSTTRTCEIGMSRGVGRTYRHLVHLVHEAVFGA